MEIYIANLDNFYYVPSDTNMIESQPTICYTLDNINTELNTINCTQVIITKWKEILKQYIKYIKQDTVAESDKASLVAYSMDCADMYGDAIYMARAIANTFDSTYFAIYDVCLDAAESRSMKVEADDKILVSPNPSTGLFAIDLPLDFNGTLSVTDVTGRPILTKHIVNGDLNTIDLSTLSGFHILTFRSLEGSISVQKILILK